MGKNIISKEQAEEIVRNCYSIADFCRVLGWQPRGNSYRIFHRYVKDYNLDISHFQQNKICEGNFNMKGKKYSLNEYLKSNSIRSKVLIKKLIEENVKERKCERCNNTEWEGELIPLEVHHIDGNHFNNSLDNIQLLCPNCHFLTENFRGRQNKKNKQYFCKKCGKTISRWSYTGLCVNCTKENQRKTIRPEAEELKTMLFEMSFSEVARKFGVSDNTIRKWCKQYGIPSSAKDYKK